MKFENIVVVPKLTMVQIEMHHSVSTREQLRARYAADGKDVDDIFESTENQLASVAILRKRFPDLICYREGFNREVADAADLVIAAGGDDHFKFISHYVTGTPILALNTDKKRSRGEMLEDDIVGALEKLKAGDFEITEDTRIEALVNGEPHISSISNYAMKRVDDPFGNFRYLIAFREYGQEEPARGDFDVHKVTSGIDVHTGTGLTDWAKGAARYVRMFGNSPDISPTDRALSWIVSEPQELYGVNLDGFTEREALERGDVAMLTGVLNKGDELHIILQKDGCGIAPDAVNVHRKNVNSGYRLVFRVAETTLKHVRMK